MGVDRSTLHPMGPGGSMAPEYLSPPEYLSIQGGIHTAGARHMRFNSKGRPFYPIP